MLKWKKKNIGIVKTWLFYRLGRAVPCSWVSNWVDSQVDLVSLRSAVKSLTRIWITLFRMTFLIFKVTFLYTHICFRSISSTWANYSRMEEKTNNFVSKLCKVCRINVVTNDQYKVPVAQAFSYHYIIFCDIFQLHVLFLKPF